MKTQKRAVICVLCILMTAFHSHAVTITGLGFLPNYNDSIAFGISADGQVVVGISGLHGYSSSEYQAFRWTASGMVGLGYLPGDKYSRAYAVSGDGLVVVGASDRYYLTVGQAIRWTSGSGMIGLGYLPGHTNSYATAVSGDGSVVVGTSGWQPYFELYPSLGIGNNQAFRWTAGSGMVGLGYLPGYTNSVATGISADGSVIVGTCSSESNSQAFYWTANSGMVALGYLPGCSNSVANGVSADGSVIVGTCYSLSNGKAFRWKAGSGMVGLGALPGRLDSSGFAVSADGSVVVGESVAAGFRWAEDVGMQGLSMGFEDPFIQTSRSVSADGSKIVGESRSEESGRPLALLITYPGIPQIPELKISSLSGGKVVLSWLTNYTYYSLQSSTQLNSTNWTYCGIPSYAGSNLVFTNSVSAGVQLFRLKK